jgi:hypothetical protein
VVVVLEIIFAVVTSDISVGNCVAEVTLSIVISLTVLIVLIVIVVGAGDVLVESASVVVVSTRPVQL